MKYRLMGILSLIGWSLTSHAIVHVENRFQLRYRCAEKKESYPKLRADVSFNRITKQWKAETFHETEAFHPAHPDREILKALSQYEIFPEAPKASNPAAIEHEFLDYKTKGEEFSLKMRRLDSEPDFEGALKLKEETSQMSCRGLIRSMSSGS